MTYYFSFRGQSPMEADLNLLETARRCELYGTKMHNVKVRVPRSDSVLSYFAILRTTKECPLV